VLIEKGEEGSILEEAALEAQFTHASRPWKLSIPPRRDL